MPYEACQRGTSNLYSWAFETAFLSGAATPNRPNVDGGLVELHYPTLTDQVDIGCRLFPALNMKIVSKFDCTIVTRYHT